MLLTLLLELDTVVITSASGIAQHTGNAIFHVAIGHKTSQQLTSLSHRNNFRFSNFSIVVVNFHHSTSATWEKEDGSFTKKIA